MGVDKEVRDGGVLAAAQLAFVYLWRWQACKACLSRSMREAAGPRSRTAWIQMTIDRDGANAGGCLPPVTAVPHMQCHRSATYAGESAYAVHWRTLGMAQMP